MEQAYAEVDAVYTNKPPGGVAYRCSFRVTEAVHCLERIVDTLAHKIGKDPATLREENFIPKEAFPYHSPLGWEYDSGDYQAAMDKAKEMIGYDDLRKEQAEKRERGGADGDRCVQLHRGAGCRAVQGLRHPGHQDVRFGRGAGAPDGQGNSSDSAPSRRDRGMRRRTRR